MRFKVALDRMADVRQQQRRVGGPVQIVEVTGGYARRVLRIPKEAPLVYRGMTLKCIGSPRWRLKHGM